jgi:hypothetical protein
MNKMNYNFDSFIDAFAEMKRIGGATPSTLRIIKKELNKFFNDSECKEVLYTDNTDKMFFGMKTIAMIDADDIYDYLAGDEAIRIGKYIVEIDSHLFNPVLDLQPHELMAIMLHEVGHLVGDAAPIENARNALNVYLASNGEYLKVSQSIHYKEILAYGLKDYLSKTHSMFYTADISEIYADEFAASYGFGNDLASAYKKITSNNMKLYENSEVSKFITFSWTLSLYKNMRVRRIGALRTLARAKQLTGSRLEQMEIDNVIRRIKRIDDDVLLESSDDGGILAKVKQRMRKARLNNLRTIDSTFYELNMQIRNVEDEDDALFLMRQINNNLAIIDEYRNSKDCDEYEADRWNEVMEKFTQLRNKLSSTIVYKNKSYGLFVNYPDIVEDRY